MVHVSQESANAQSELTRLKLMLSQLKEKKTDSTLCQSFAKIQHQKGVRSRIEPSLQCVRNLTGHTGRIYDVCWSDNQSDTIVSVSQDGRLLVWEACSGFKTHIIRPISQWLMSCAMSPSGRIVACGGLDNNCSLYRLSAEPDLEEDAPTYRIMRGHQGYISSCRFIPNDNSKIVTASGDQSCAIWDVETSQRLISFCGHTSDVLCLSMSVMQPNTFMSGSCDGTAKLWDTRAAAQRQQITLYQGQKGSQLYDLNSLHTLTDGNSVAAGYEDGCSSLFDIRSTHALQSYIPMQSSSKVAKGVTSVATSHSGRLLFVAHASSDCLVWDTLTATVVGQLDRHSNRISRLSLSPDGSAMCSASWDATLKIWVVNDNDNGTM